MRRDSNVARSNLTQAVQAALCTAMFFSLAGCGLATPPPDTAIAPPGAFGSNGDNDIAALNLSSWAFSSSANLRNHPIDAARAAAAVDYLGGQLSSSPRWIGLSPIIADEMLQARQQVRGVLGISLNAPSQVVVSSLAGYAATLAQGGSQAQANQYLANPAFTLGPQMTQAKLENIPFLSGTNIATQRAAASGENGLGTSDSAGR